MRTFLTLSFLIVSLLFVGAQKMIVTHAWKSLEFNFSSQQARNAAIANGKFKPGAPVPIDVDVFYEVDGEPVTFITIPRIQKGVPATLGIVTKAVTPEGNPVIDPYPSWEWNTPGSNCDGLTSVFRVKVDSCNRLWVLDTGKLVDKQVCPPQLLSFDLTRNKFTKRYKFPDDQFTHDSLFVTPIVDIGQGHSGNRCRDTFVYIADITGFALIVYDDRNSRSWKITNKLFYPYPPYGTFNIKGQSFELMDGILGLALGPRTINGDRILFFHALSSATENWVMTSVIKNQSLFQEESDSVPEAFHLFPAGRRTQSAPHDIDNNGNMFFGLMSDLAIGCWNVNNFPDYGKNLDIAHQDSETLQFASGLKVITPRSGRQQLWVLTSSFQKFMTGTLNPDELNFRILAAVVDELVRNTRCAASNDIINITPENLY